MTNVIVLYKLKPGVTRDAFEHWLRETDFPAMQALQRVKSLVVYRVERRVMGEATASADYVDVFDVPDIKGFIAEDFEVAETQKVMAEFRTFAQDPEYLLADAVLP